MPYFTKDVIRKIWEKRNWIGLDGFGLMERTRRSDNCNNENRGWPCSIRYVRCLWVESWTF